MSETSSRSSPFREIRKVKKKHTDWFNFKFDDNWYLYSLIYGCFGILILVLIQRKWTNQKGKWNKNLNIDNIYIYRDNRIPSENKTESKGELECRRYLETIFQVPFPKARPNFLKNPITGNNLEIDCFNPTLKLGVEYNGQQHYSYTSYFHRNADASMNQKYRDELKRRICHENGVNLIEVPYTIKLKDIGPFLQFKLQQLGYI
jgi:hypothetical protein